jgi:FAD/FMN-containing dehydrogenase
LGQSIDRRIHRAGILDCHMNPQVAQSAVGQNASPQAAQSAVGQGPSLMSWGNYPKQPQTGHTVYWRDSVAPLLANLANRQRHTLAFGAGRSYGDSCYAASDHVIDMRGLDRFIDADWQTGVISVEAGISFQQLLAITIARGWFVSVTPGTQFLTIGGAIANDVHGKNHHHVGSFGSFVRQLTLLRSDQGVVTCSRTENPELFHATVAGLGLTGVILTAEIQLAPIASSDVNVMTQRFDNLDQFFSLSDQYDAQHAFSVSWMDCLAKGSALGRGIYVAGDFANAGRRCVASSARMAMPIMPPISLVNSLSLRAFNTLYWRRAPRQRKHAIVDYAKFFYPLDRIENWNRIYGKKGFQQFQCVLPTAQAKAGIRALLQAIAAKRAGSFLAVLKRCGDLPSPGLLSFPLAGTSLALDFPQHDQQLPELFSTLNQIVRECGGRLYPAKDAQMSAEDFQTAYPNWRQLEALRDPALLSKFWQRVTRCAA